MIFLGDGNAGKTHTIERFLKGGLDRDIHTEQTPGINIRTWEPICGKSRVKINFWDFGGQEIMYSMHRCFLTDRSLYVIVLRERPNGHPDDLTIQARNWLEIVQSFAPNCSVILAVNREFGSPGIRGINTRQLLQEFPQIVGEPIIYCAVSDKLDNFEVLTKMVINQVFCLDSAAMEFPLTWNEVRTELEMNSNRRGRSGSRYYIDKEDYQKLCITQGITDDNIQRWLLEWFNDLGICFSYHQEEGRGLERYHVLNPEWLTNAIYAIICIGQRPEFSDNGVITRSEIDRILGREALKDPYQYVKERTAREPIAYDDNEQGYVLDIMKKFNLCAQLGEREFFIPALCPLETPENFRPRPEEYQNHTRFEFRYGFLPDSVIHRLMIACIRAGFHRTVSYFGGIRVDFEADEVILTAEADTAKKALSLDIYYQDDPYLGRMKLTWLRKRVAEINSATNLKPDYEVLVVYDKENIADLRLDTLFKLHERGVKKHFLSAYRAGEVVECNLDAALQLLYSKSVIQSADRIIKDTSSNGNLSYREALATAEAGTLNRKAAPEQRFRLGISFAHEQRDYVRQMFADLIADGGFDREELFFDEWYDYQINGGNGDLAIKKVYYNHCEKIIVLFSDAYLKRYWTYKVEWMRAISPRMIDDRKIVCLLRWGNIEIDSIEMLNSKQDIVKDVSTLSPEQTAEFILDWYYRPDL